MKVLLKLAGCGSVINLDKNTQLSPHFKLSELANNKGDIKLPQYEINAHTADFLTMIEELRVWYNKPITCNCCYRQAGYNSEQCGALPDSLHLEGLAFDWGVKHNKVQQQHVIEKWLLINQAHGTQGVIGIYPWGYHLSPYATRSQIAKGITGFYIYHAS